MWSLSVLGRPKTKSMTDDEVSLISSFLFNLHCFVKCSLHWKTVTMIVVCHGFLHYEVVLILSVVAFQKQECQLTIPAASARMMPCIPVPKTLCTNVYSNMLYLRARLLMFLSPCHQSLRICTPKCAPSIRLCRISSSSPAFF